MNIDYASLDADIESGLFRNRLEEELTFGLRQLHDSGERLPPASYLAAQIAEIVNRDIELSSEVKYNLYQEILSAVENARTAVLGDDTLPS